MNRFFIIVFSLLSVFTVSARNTDEALGVLQRVSRQSSIPISLELKKDGSNMYYEYSVVNGVLRLKGSDNVALCRGFYDYVKAHKLGMYSWSGNNIQLPSSLPATNDVKVVSPFQNHYYFNVCTYGYSMPYWDWTRWEQEIDWMALHGINMPLALVGYEAILARVWKKMGLTDEEINGYFVGPAHLPWMRMGNVSGIDGPLNADWHKDQLALQHKILNRMRSLGMKPICPGFPGFIPEAFKRIYPNLNIVETHWGGAFHNWMISPTEPLFAKISEAFIREWEKEFGKCDYYLVDSFNEMDIPFPEKGNPARYDMAATYGEKVYNAIKKANKNAVWVMQGWMFGYQRHIWDYETLGALVSRVPDDKMLLLDLAVDYNKHFWHSEVNWEYYKGFYNKQWVYSVIPNMGGKVGMTGVLDFYANGHLEALASANRGNLVAHGLAPEGIENNEVLYELVTDAGWSNRHIDVREWLRQYSLNRYGAAPEQLMTAWDYLMKSVYGSFTDHPRFNWQLRPGSVKNGSINMNADYFRGLESFIAASDKLKDSPYFLTDLCEMTAHYLGGKAELLTRLIDQEYLLGDTLKARFLQSRFETLMLGMDRILSQHPTLRLDRWLSFAQKSAHTDAQRKQYETNARRIVTVWGPPVDDYAARIWSGLIGNYYLGRWKEYYRGRESGEQVNLAQWERRWVEDNHDSYHWNTDLDIVGFAKEMLALSKDISAASLLLNRPNMVGTWSIGSGETKDFEFHIPARMLSNMKGITLEYLRGNGMLECSDVILKADGIEVVSSSEVISYKNGMLYYKLVVPSGVNANNGCVLKLKLKSMNGSIAGTIACDM